MNLALHMRLSVNQHVLCLNCQDGCLSMRCKQSLPFNGAFAHAVYMPGLSTVAWPALARWDVSS